MSVLDDISKANSSKSLKRTPSRPGLVAGPWKKGQSGNPSGRPRVPREVVEACRALTPLALGALQDVVERWGRRDHTVRASDVTRAAEALLDRAWGKAPETVRLEAAEVDDTLALNPATLDIDALAHLAALVRHLPSGSTAELKTDAAPRRPASTVTVDHSAGVPSEGPSGPDAE